jgi:hypothetical protein
MQHVLLQHVYFFSTLIDFKLTGLVVDPCSYRSSFSILIGTSSRSFATRLASWCQFLDCISLVRLLFIRFCWIPPSSSRICYIANQKWKRKISMLIETFSTKKKWLSSKLGLLTSMDGSLGKFNMLTSGSSTPSSSEHIYNKTIYLRSGDNYKSMNTIDYYVG